MPKPVCVKCQCFFRPAKTGYYLTEMMPADGVREAPRGTKAPHLWEPYKLWAADLWKCPECGHEIVAGFSAHPIAERHHPDFDDAVIAYGADRLKVNDC